jgi:hypothetical protein
LNWSRRERRVCKPRDGGKTRVFHMLVVEQKRSFVSTKRVI